VSLWIRSIVKQTTSRFSSSCLPDERRVLSASDTSSSRQATNVRIKITRFHPNPGDGSPLCLDIEEISLIKLFVAGGLIVAFLIVGSQAF
jgi:hypothetical protein